MKTGIVALVLVFYVGFTAVTSTAEDTVAEPDLRLPAISTKVFADDSAHASELIPALITELSDLTRRSLLSSERANRFLLRAFDDRKNQYLGQIGAEEQPLDAQLTTLRKRLEERAAARDRRRERGVRRPDATGEK